MFKRVNMSFKKAKKKHTYVIKERSLEFGLHDKREFVRDIA